MAIGSFTVDGITRMMCNETVAVTMGCKSFRMQIVAAMVLFICIVFIVIVDVVVVVRVSRLKRFVTDGTGSGDVKLR